MIQPGLQRITKLLDKTSLPWRAVHVAGTNGKGSVCNYVGAMLDLYNQHKTYRLTGHRELTWATFTSPHLIDRWDGIVINGETISQHGFSKIEEQFLDKNHAEKIDASEFEILAATAFSAFTQANVDIGIVEVGMGGTLDATNVLGTSTSQRDEQVLRAKPLVTAIAKIGLDHQAFLGDNIPEIAAHKAGIIKSAVPVVYDESNEESARHVFNQTAAAHGSAVHTFDSLPQLARLADWNYLPAGERPERVFGTRERSVSTHVQQNTSVALRATWLALQQLHRLDPTSQPHLHPLIQEMSAVGVKGDVSNRGRLEKLDLRPWLGAIAGEEHAVDVLLDGAHNVQSALVLKEQIQILRREQQSKTGSSNMTWILTASHGRDVKSLFAPLLEPGDSVFAVEFGPVAGMPWVKPVSAQDILTDAASVMSGDCGTMVNCGRDVRSALMQATSHAAHDWTVIAGSLYLAGDVHKILKHGRLDSG